MNGPENGSEIEITGDESLFENLEKTVKYEEVFLDRQDQIDKALKKITDEKTRSDGDEFVDLLNVALSGIGDTDEEITQAAFGFYQLILERRGDAGEILYNLEASDEFVKTVLDWIIDYSEEIRRLNYRQTQGSEWWSSYNVERILRDEGISHRHRFIIDMNEEVQIDSVPRSDWAIIYTLVGEFVESYNVSDDGLEYMLPLHVFNSTRELIYKLEAQADKEGIELPDRDKLLEDFGDEE